MILNKQFIILFFVIILIYSSISIFIFDTKINATFTLFHMEKQKKIINIALSYNKLLMQVFPNRSKELIEEYEFINRSQAYLWLLSSYEKRIKKSIISSMVIISSVLISLLLFLFYLLLRKLLFPIQQIIKSLNHYINHKSVKKVIVKGNKEFHQILQQFNFIMEELAAKYFKEQVESSVKNWQTVAKMMVHEIKNQLSPVTLKIESILYYALQNKIDVQKELLLVNKNISNIEKIIVNFKTFSNLPVPNLRKLRIRKILKRIIEENFSNYGFIFLKTSEDFEIISDEFYLLTIFVNLIKNSIEACKENSKPQIIIKIATNKQKSVAIIDNGIGIPEEMLLRIFKPGFTSKDYGDGIGLFIVKELANCLNIDITVSSDYGKRTEFILTFKQGLNNE